jgi:hypothetical protein
VFFDDNGDTRGLVGRRRLWKLTAADEALYNHTHELGTVVRCGGAEGLAGERAGAEGLAQRGWGWGWGWRRARLQHPA